MAKDETNGCDAPDKRRAGRVIEGHRGRVLQDKKEKTNGFTAERRETFLDTLAETCNVSLAIAASGKAASSVYRTRARDPEFADQWQAALEIGYARLESALVRRALEAADGYEIADREANEPPVGAMTVAQAMDLLSRHRASIARGSAAGHRPNRRRAPTAEETDRALMKRLAILKRMRRQEAQ